MASAKGIIAKLNTALNKVNVSDRVVYKRVVTRSGGDDLLGRPGSVDYTDTKLVPPPAYQRLGRNIVGNNAPAVLTLGSSGSDMQVADDYAIVISPTSMSRAELSNPDVMIVFKDSAGKEEVFRISDFEPQAYQGIDIVTTAYLRSVKRAGGS